MTWSISASGPIATTRPIVEASPCSASSEPERRVFDAAKELCLAILDAAPEGSSCSVSASGHTGGDRSYASISVSTTEPAAG